MKPERFLDYELVEYGEEHTDNTLQRMAYERIQGIDKLEVIEHWIEVEISLNRGPRRTVISWLNQRKRWLEEHGERPADLRTEWPHELPDRYQPADRATPAKEVYIVTSDGKRVPYDEHRRNSASAKLKSIRTDSEEVATDGGETA